MAVDEENRHRLEVRRLVDIWKRQGDWLAQDYLMRVETARGKPARERLEQELLRESQRRLESRNGQTQARPRSAFKTHP